MFITRRLLRSIASLSRLRRDFLQFCRQSCGSRIGGRTKNRAAQFCAVALVCTGTNTFGHFHRFGSKLQTQRIVMCQNWSTGSGGGLRRESLFRGFWAMDYVITGCLSQSTMRTTRQRRLQPCFCVYALLGNCEMPLVITLEKATVVSKNSSWNPFEKSGHLLYWQNGVVRAGFWAPELDCPGQDSDQRPNERHTEKRISSSLWSQNNPAVAHYRL